MTVGTAYRSLGQYVAALAEQYKLGGNQRNVLVFLLERSGTWHSGSAWVWGTTSQTERIMQSLVRKGLVTKTASGRGFSVKPEFYSAAREIRDRERAAQSRVDARRQAEVDRKRAEAEARSAATADLMDIHADEFNALLAKHRRTRGL